MTILNLLSDQTLPLARIIVCGVLFLAMIAILICGFVFSSDKRRERKVKKNAEKNVFAKKPAPKKSSSVKKTKKPAQNKTAVKTTEIKRPAPEEKPVVSAPKQEPAAEQIPAEEKEETVLAAVAEEKHEAVSAVSEEKARMPIRTGVLLYGREMSAETRKALNLTDSEYDGKLYRVVYKPSFAARLALSDDNIKNEYEQLCARFYSYKKVRIRTSRRQQRIGKGRDILALVFFKGKKLAVALNLDPDEYAQTKYRGKDMSAKRRFAKTPMLLKITSERKLNYAKFLIGRAAENLGLKELPEPKNSAVILPADKEKLIETGEIAVKAKEVDPQENM